MTKSELPGPLSPNQYTNLRFLKRGGMGEIWLADDRDSAQEVAIKIVAASDPSLLGLLRQEGGIALSLRHTNIVQTFHIGSFQDGGVDNFYMAMEFAPQGSLANLMKGLADFLPLDEALQSMIQISSGIAEAHKSIVHRDLKPDNILVDNEGVLKITDFGLSKYLTAATRTQTFKGWGTFAYMAPECWLSEKNTTRMDIYSMGIIFYELLAKAKPYSASTELEWRDHHLYDPLPNLRTVRTDLPDRLIDTISKMTSKRAEDRYQSASELLPVLEEIVRALRSGQAGNDPLVSKARSAVEQRKAQLLEQQREHDLAEQVTKFQRTSIEFLSSLFSKRIESINENLEQTKIRISPNLSDQFRAEFLESTLEFRFFPGTLIAKYLQERKEKSLEGQRRHWGFVMQEVSPSALETDRVVLVGTITVGGEGVRSGQSYGANLLLRKSSTDDLYGEWWLAWFDDNALFAKSTPKSHYPLLQNEFLKEYEIGRSHVTHVRTMITKKLDQNDVEEYINRLLI